MLTIIFIVMMISFFGRMLVWCIRAAWSIGMFLFTLVILPIFLIALVCAGLIYVAIPVLVICGIVALVKHADVR